MARILLITDDQALTRMTLWILAEQKHEATSCDGADKAIATFREFPPDIVLFNGAPGEEKHRHAERMYAALPGLQIVGLHDHSHRLAQRHIRAEGHLHKPFHAEDLIGLVNALLTAT